MKRKFKVGDVVEWIASPYLKDKYIASGTILKIYETVVGSSKRCLVAQIRIECAYHHDKETTTISLNKLIKPTSEEKS